MKVEVIKSIRLKNRWVSPGTILKVRYFPSNQLIQRNQTYQVIAGKFSGCNIPKEYCIKIPDEKTYSEKEWNDMENHYMNLLEKEREKVLGLQKERDNLRKLIENHINKYIVANQVSNMLDEWLNAEYQVSEEVDRKNFSLKLTNFIQGKLV